MTALPVIASVTAALQALLIEGLVRPDGPGESAPRVSVLRPDRLSADPPGGARVNLLLYRVDRDAAFASRSPPDGSGPPARALTLHYLLTADADRPLEAELLLDRAMQALDAAPVLSTNCLLRLLTAARAGLPPPFGTAAAAPFAEALDAVRIVPDVMTSEDLTRLWRAMQAPYRPALPYSALAMRR